eukprot:TRINITY_DN25131_c0_g1_i3.p1 TRINITY_DN25131_c0_g1~~TRINITY_DN25131_c0_g1_i3.p1  ORF type:complete len:868 (-),score=237.82 TRINITY_DN25131_c0_g1_i3:72-2591(-)
MRRGYGTAAAPPAPRGLTAHVRQEDERWQQRHPCGRAAAAAAPSESEVSVGSSYLENALRTQLASVDAYQAVIRTRAAELEQSRAGVDGEPLTTALHDQLDASNAYREEISSKLADVSAGRQATRIARRLEAEAREHRRRAEDAHSRARGGLFGGCADGLSAGPALPSANGNGGGLFGGGAPGARGARSEAGSEASEGAARYGLGHRILEDRHARGPLGGEVEAGWGIGNRSIPQQRGPRGGELQAGWGLGNRVLDDRHGSQPLGGEVEAGYGIGNRVLADRHAAGPVGGEVEAGYGIDGRILENEHAAKPLGGEVEAGYGIGNRILADRHVKKPVHKTEVLTGPDAAEAVLRDKIALNYGDLRAAFQSLDRSDNGYISRADFLEAMEHVFFPEGRSREELAAVARRFDLNGDGFISYNEFVAYVEGKDCKRVAQQEPMHSAAECVGDVDMAIQAFKQALDDRFSTLREAFLSMSKERKAALGRDEFYAALRAHDVEGGTEQLEAIRRRFDPSDSGGVTYPDFCRVISRSLQYGKHLDRQMFRDSADVSAASASASAAPRGAANGASAQALSPAKMETLRRNLRGRTGELRDAFDRIDRKGTGCALRADLRSAVENLLRRDGLSREEIAGAVQLLGLVTAGVVSCDEMLSALGGDSDKAAAARSRPGPEEVAGYGIGNRILEDRHVAQPLGGEIEAGYGIGNRILEERHARKLAPRPQPASKADAAEAALREKIRINYGDLRSAFRALDRSDNGYVTRADFMEAMHNVFLPVGFGKDDLLEVAHRFDLNGDGYISFNEFVAYVEGQECSPAVEAAGAEKVHNAVSREARCSSRSRSPPR